MRREIFLVTSGVVLSFIILTAVSWITLRLSPFADALAERGGSSPEAGDPFQLIEETTFVLDVFAFPLTFFLVALFVAAFARTRSSLLALISVLPLLAFFLISGSWTPKTITIGIGYLVLTAIVSIAVTKFRRAKSTDSPATKSTK
jgi:hypothetical protein